MIPNPDLTVETIKALVQEKTDAEAKVYAIQKQIEETGLYEALREYIAEVDAPRTPPSLYHCERLRYIEIRDDEIYFYDPTCYDGLESATLPFAWLTDRISVIKEIRTERLAKEAEQARKRREADEQREREQLARLVRKYGVPE